MNSRKDLGLKTLADLEAWFARNTSYGGLLPPRPRRRGLEPITSLLEEGGRPQDRFLSVQVVGSRGKGTTASFLAQLSRACGLKVGLFTSPHLVRLTERIRVDGREIPGSRMASLLEEILSFPRAWEAGFFDLVTALAALHFAREGVDLAVFEAGRGGETDSTTALGADLLVFTGLDRDHLDVLGESEEERARVKTAALAPGGTLISGAEIRSVAGAVALGLARHRGASPFFLGKDFFFHGLEWGPGIREIRFRSPSLLGGEGEWRLRVRSLAPFLDQNVSLAAAAYLFLERTGRLPRRPEGLPQVSLEVPPGRFEVVRLDPPLVLDGAQSPLAFRALLAAWNRAFPLSRKPKVLLALGKDKDLPGVMAALAEGGAGEVVCLQVDSSRGRAPEVLLEAARAAGLAGRVLQGGAAEGRSLVLSGREPWLVAGSFYLVGAFHSLAAKALERPGNPPSRRRGMDSGGMGA